MLSNGSPRPYNCFLNNCYVWFQMEFEMKTFYIKISGINPSALSFLITTILSSSCCINAPAPCPEFHPSQSANQYETN